MTKMRISTTGSTVNNVTTKNLHVTDPESPSRVSLLVSVSSTGKNQIYVGVPAGGMNCQLDDDALDQLTDWLIQHRQERNLVDLATERAGRSIARAVDKMLAHSV